MPPAPPPSSLQHVTCDDAPCLDIPSRTPGSWLQDSAFTFAVEALKDFEVHRDVAVVALRDVDAAPASSLSIAFSSPIISTRKYAP